MKPQKRAFVVEVKSSRRGKVSQPKSIWDGTALKDIAREVDDDLNALASRTARMQSVILNGSAVSDRLADDCSEGTSDARNRPEALTTYEDQASKDLPSTQETAMSDENIQTGFSDPAPLDTPDSEVPLKKKRRPRRSREQIEAGNAAKAASFTGKKTRAKRGSVTTKAFANAEVEVKPSKTDSSNRFNAAQLDSIIDVDDLAQLEEENLSLRKQLADKLRAENAELRRRLA